MVRAFDTELHAQRTYRELKLLTHLNHPDAQVCLICRCFEDVIFNIIGCTIVQCVHTRYKSERVSKLVCRYKKKVLYK